MSDPLALLPMALAAGGGRVNEHEAGQLVAAGFTLLQRSASLVRDLSGRRAAIVLPTSAAYITALAASDGRGAVLIDPLASPADIAFQSADANVGAVFTLSAFMPRIPAGMTVVLLDDAPRRARVIAQGVSRLVDLGSHHGLSLEGERDAPGSDEEAAVVYTSPSRGTSLGAVLTHANLLANARASVLVSGGTADDHVLALLPFAKLFGLTVTGVAPLLAGARVTTMDRIDHVRVTEALGRGITHLIGVPALFRILLGALERRAVDGRFGMLRVCVCGGGALSVDLQERWANATGVELRQGYGVTEASPVCLFNGVAHPNVRGTVGRPVPGVEIAILRAAVSATDSGHAVQSAATAVPDGETGEICVRGANVFRGYLHHRASARSLRNGWLHTGELGSKNPDGTVTLRQTSQKGAHGRREPTFG